MKHLIVFSLLVCGFASAQLGLKLESEQSCYMRYEQIKLRLTIRNYSGNTLVFGGADSTERGRLSFVIRNQANQLVTSLDPKANPLQDMILSPGMSRELTLIINSLFDMQRADTYKIEAHVEHYRLPHICASEPILVDVREGIVWKERVVGLPMRDGASAINSVQVKLMQFTDSIGSIWCLRVEDDEHVYGTFRLGPYMSSSTPQMDADGGSAIHILIQVSPRLYSYTVYSMIGEVVKLRQQVYYVAEGGYPQLSRASGYLKVINARVAKLGTDYNIKPERDWRKDARNNP
ncbi:MAG: hypothetical protein GX561_15630 [Lentisphaerae bacterium]|jgi:hypothetical protein|nr:hypothetical protein [Lentisphaerota bacterium]